MKTKLLLWSLIVPCATLGYAQQYQLTDNGATYGLNGRTTLNDFWLAQGIGVEVADQVQWYFRMGTSGGFQTFSSLDLASSAQNTPNSADLSFVDFDGLGIHVDLRYELVGGNGHSWNGQTVTVRNTGTSRRRSNSSC
jgi:hypothetical protein